MGYDRGYMPGELSSYTIDPDRTMDRGRGICIDFASLTAAMLRSQGVPARLVFGYMTYMEEPE